MTKAPSPAKKSAAASKHKISTDKKSSNLKGGAQKVLNVAVALSWQKDTNEVSRDDIVTVVGAQCGITGKSTIANAFTDLKKANLIVLKPKFVEILEKGKEQADTSQIKISIPKNTQVRRFPSLVQYPLKKSPIDLTFLNHQEYLDSMKEMHKLKEKEAKLLDCLVDGLSHPKADVAAAIDCKLNSTFANMLTKLKKAGLIILGKELQLTDEMRKYE
jgi:hypothetical protein